MVQKERASSGKFESRLRELLPFLPDHIEPTTLRPADLVNELPASL